MAGYPSFYMSLFPLPFWHVNNIYYMVNEMRTFLPKFVGLSTNCATKMSKPCADWVEKWKPWNGHLRRVKEYDSGWTDWSLGPINLHSLGAHYGPPRETYSNARWWPNDHKCSDRPLCDAAIRFWLGGIGHIKRKSNHFGTLRIMGSQNWWFGDSKTLLYRFKSLHLSNDS